MSAQHQRSLTAFGAGMRRAIRQLSCYQNYRVLPVLVAFEPIG